MSSIAEFAYFSERSSFSSLSRSNSRVRCARPLANISIAGIILRVGFKGTLGVDDHLLEVVFCCADAAATCRAIALNSVSAKSVSRSSAPP